jgi:hypothetical protein
MAEAAWNEVEGELVQRNTRTVILPHPRGASAELNAWIDKFQVALQTEVELLGLLRTGGLYRSEHDLGARDDFQSDWIAIRDNVIADLMRTLSSAGDEVLPRATEAVLLVHMVKSLIVTRCYLARVAKQERRARRRGGAA